MFNGCRSLTSLCVSNFDTSQVTNMASTFVDCASLTSLDLSNFNTPKVTNMNFMFKNCTVLESLDIRNFSSASLKNCNDTFTNVPSTCKVYVNKTKFTKKEFACGFNGKFTNVA